MSFTPAERATTAFMLNGLAAVGDCAIGKSGKTQRLHQGRRVYLARRRHSHWAKSPPDDRRTRQVRRTLRPRVASDCALNCNSPETRPSPSRNSSFSAPTTDWKVKPTPPAVIVT